MLHRLRPRAQKARRLVVVTVMIRRQLPGDKEALLLLLLEEELSLDLLDLGRTEVGKSNRTDTAHDIQGGILIGITPEGGILKGVAIQVWILNRGGEEEGGGGYRRRVKKGSERRGRGVGEGGGGRRGRRVWEGGGGITCHKRLKCSHELLIDGVCRGRWTTTVHIYSRSHGNLRETRKKKGTQKEEEDLDKNNKKETTW